MRSLFSSESVTEGHPDKTADKISDAILDAHLKADPESRVACETLVKTGAVVLAGEITSRANVDYQDVVSNALKDIGYNSATGFDYATCAVINMLSKQSPDISQGVTAGHGDFNHEEQGAGDQGLMFGYATNETPEFMPLPILLAQKLTRRLTDVRKNVASHNVPWLRPDGKSQVAVMYDNDKAVGLENVVLAAHHSEDVTTGTLREELEYRVIRSVCGDLVTPDTKFYINATGRFVLGGPVADAGLTGRKIIVDTYGGKGRHGGGAFSGKDPSKVDRSAAYAARYIAKNIVAAGLADECEIQLAYCIGLAEPTSIRCDLKNGHVDAEKLSAAIYDIFPVKPGDIIKHFSLKKPRGWSYYETAAGGHFGRDQFPWEKTDKVEELKGYF